MELVIASSNLNKIREFKEIFKSLKINHLDILSLHQFPTYHAPEEIGADFQEIAALKALDAAKKLGKTVLAEDSGLVVPQLQGKPGIFSRRYSGPSATDLENNQKLLLNMKDFPEGERSAYYECCIVIASPHGILKSATGTCEGHILLQQKGNHGFGYDPLFVKNDYEKSFGELDDSIKNRVSHRRKAFERVAALLENLQPFS